MTQQIPNHAVDKSRGKWRLTTHDDGFPGGAQIQLLHNGKVVRSFDVRRTIPDCRSFSRFTTAGIFWDEQSLIYLDDLDSSGTGEPKLVVRTWWEGRAVIGLESQSVLPNAFVAANSESFDLQRCLSRERSMVMKTLRIVAGRKSLDHRHTLCHDDTQAVDVMAAMHFAGRMKLREAIPLLRDLEQRLPYNSQVYAGEYAYNEFKGRRLAQTALRRMGETPACLPPVELFNYANAPVSPAQRVAGAHELRIGMSQDDLFRLLGSPDHAERFSQQWWWRYDIDGDEPFTLSVMMDDNDSVADWLRVTPPLWVGPAALRVRYRDLCTAEGALLPHFRQNALAHAVNAAGDGQ